MIKKFYKFLNEEVDYSMVPTSFVTGFTIKEDVYINTFEFVSDKGNSYTVYINDTYESNHLLDSGDYLFSFGNNPIPTIYFSATERGFNILTFNTLTNRSEYLEVMGKVIFIISIYINNNQQYNIFSVSNLDTKREKFYRHYLSKLSISNVEIGLSDFYFDKNNNPQKIYYLIR